MKQPSGDSRRSEAASRWPDKLEFSTAQSAETASLRPNSDKPASGKADTLRPGDRVGNCQVERLLGRGGMGEVYLARHETLGCYRAVKVLPAKHADESLIARFVREARTLAQLQHPHLATAVDAGQQGSIAYLVMEYVEGTNLRDYVRQHGPLDFDVAARLMTQALAGLEYAHRLGVIHRDIKPGNLLLTPTGIVKILDLGLARLLEDPAHPDRTLGADGLTAAGEVMGTWDYLPPEQAEDAARADARSDLYSLGCTWFELVTGRPPFADQQGPLAKLRAHALAAVPRLENVRPDAPPHWSDLIARLLAKRPEDRFASAEEARKAVESALAHASHPAENPKPLAGTRHRTAAWIGGALLAVSVLLVGAMLAGNAYWDSGSEQPLPKTELPATAADPLSETAATAGEPQPPALQPPAVRLVELQLIVAAEGTGGMLHSWTLTESSSNTPGESRRGRLPEQNALGPDAAFKVLLSADSAVAWQVWWFDTLEHLAAGPTSPGKQTQWSYPEGDQFQTIHPDDPAGKHLLVFVAWPSEQLPNQAIEDPLLSRVREACLRTTANATTTRCGELIDQAAVADLQKAFGGECRVLAGLLLTTHR